MKKRVLSMLLCMSMVITLFTGCGSKDIATENSAAVSVSKSLPIVEEQQEPKVMVTTTKATAKTATKETIKPTKTVAKKTTGTYRKTSSSEENTTISAAEFEQNYQDACESWTKQATWTASNGVSIKINDAWADIVTSGNLNGGGSYAALYYDGTEDLTPTSPYRLAIYEFIYSDEAYLNGVDRYNPSIVDVSTLPVIPPASSKQTSAPKSEEFKAYKEAFDVMYGFQRTGKWKRIFVEQLQNYESGIGLTVSGAEGYLWRLDYVDSTWKLWLRINPSELQWNAIENSLRLVSPDGDALYQEFFTWFYYDSPTFPEYDTWVSIGNSQAKVQVSDSGVYFYFY